MLIPDLSLESKLWSDGCLYVAGVDEAGRGPWAGPVVAGAAVFSKDSEATLPLKDSKKMTAESRDAVFDDIKAEAIGCGVGIVDANEIDNIGIQKAVQLAMLMAVKAAEQMLEDRIDYLIIDGGNVFDIDGYKQSKINKGDNLHYSVSAGAILAKVTRDRLMEDYAKQYPMYKFDKHKGYGTKIHKEALEQHGPCKIHRYSYKPVAKVAEQFEKSRL